MKKIRVLVVDDSALVRSLLAGIINRQNDMVCVGAANGALQAREMIRELNPDVITLDVEMPHMDGIEFLRRLMRLRPTPVVMISTMTERGAGVTMRALELGAVDFVTKPRIRLIEGLDDSSALITEKIRMAADVRVKRQSGVGFALQEAVSDVAAAKFSSIALVGGVVTEKMVFIGASTGGTEAIKEILTKLPAVFPAVVITQHMPPGFTTSFAARLNALCRVAVQEAVNGERLLPGHAYIAPGGKQFRVGRNGASYVAVVEDAELVNRHRPSVEVLFQSAAQNVGCNAFGIMLTGMGCDGAKAMRQMKDAGSYNYVQDEMTSVVFGMPREAILQGAADEVLALTDIAPALIARLVGSPDRLRLQS